MAAKAGSIAIERVAQLILMLGAAPILGVVSFGRFSFANSVTALLAFGTDLGLTLWTTRALAREPALRVDGARLAERSPSREGPGTLPGFPDKQAAVLGTAYHLRLWATVPYFIALAGVAASLGPGEARIAMLAIGVVSLARALLDHARAVFRARERIGDEGKVNAIGASLATIGGLSAVVLTRRAAGDGARHDGGHARERRSTVSRCWGGATVPGPVRSTARSRAACCAKRCRSGSPGSSRWPTRAATWSCCARSPATPRSAPIAPRASSTTSRRRCRWW